MAMRQKSSVSAVTSKDGPDGKWALAALPNQTAEKVIGASEELFAKFGYGACTFKMISAKSKVNQGLIYYYFGSKEKLFSEIFMRWAEPLARRRNMMLDELERAAGAWKTSSARPRLRLTCAKRLNKQSNSRWPAFWPRNNGRKCRKIKRAKKERLKGP
jgi:AcrR family transcriptional regulator